MRPVSKIEVMRFATTIGLVLEDGNLDGHARRKRCRVDQFVLVGDVNIEVKIGSAIVLIRE